MNANMKTGYPSIDKPWLKHYSKEAKSLVIPNKTIWQLMYDNNKDNLMAPAIICLDKKINYGQLLSEIDQAQKAFVHSGVKANDIVTIAMPSLPEALIALYALNKIGAVANMIHPLAGSKEVVRYLNEVKSEYCVLFTETYKAIKDSINETNIKKAIVVSASLSLHAPISLLYKIKNKELADYDGVFVSWRQFMSEGEASVHCNLSTATDKLALISHTGGTTGTPKGVMLTDKNINAEILQIGSTMKYERTDRMLVVLPPFINYSLVNSMLEPLALGMCIVLIPEYKLELFSTYMKKYKPNHINSIPPYLSIIPDIPESKAPDFSKVKNLFYGGDALDTETEQKINEYIQRHGSEITLCKGLGSTELVCAATATYQHCNVVGSVGVPLVQVDCVILDVDTGLECKYGQSGEICFTGETLMQGYYENSKETDEVIQVHKDGKRWLHTGDLGYMDENGVLFLVGRMKRILITKDKNGTMTKLFPSRIEKEILCHPAVGTCCAIAIPHTERVNVAAAYIVLNRDDYDKEQTVKEVMELCKRQLPDYMLPEFIEVINELPRTDRGKVDYRKLEEMAQELSD